MYFLQKIGEHQKSFYCWAQTKNYPFGWKGSFAFRRQFFVGQILLCLFFFEKNTDSPIFSTFPASSTLINHVFKTLHPCLNPDFPHKKLTNGSLYLIFAAFVHTNSKVRLTRWKYIAGMLILLNWISILELVRKK